MDAVKFVPPGGHRACLSCSAAKAKCVFSDDAEAGDGFIDGLDFINSTGSDLAGPSQSASSASSGQDGTPAVPRCQRCERLNRDCLLPTRPRKKRRVGSIKPGTSRSTFSVAPQTASPHQKATPSRIASANLGGHGAAASPSRLPGAATGVSGSGSGARQTSSFPASRIPSLSKLPTPSGGASSASYRGGSSQPLQKRTTSGTPHSTLQSGSAIAGPPSSLPMQHQQQQLQHQDLHLQQQQQYANGVTPPTSVKAAPTSIPIPAAPLVPPPPPAFSLPPPPPVSSPPSVDPASLQSYAGSSSSATVIPPGGLGGSTGVTSSVASPMPSGPGAPPQEPAAPAVPSPNAHQVLIDSVFNMEEREAEELLRFYRDAFSKFNPYMEPTPPDTKVADLQAQKPLVWLTIVFVTCFHDFERQNRLARAIIYYITDQVFLNSSKSLHLLQGLLIFVNWFISQNFVLPQFTNLTHITMALITDLGLNKLEFSKTHARSPLDRYVTKTMHGPGMVAPDAGHTLEERRALAGGFVLSHAMSDGILMVTPLHYTLQLEDTCRFFEAAYYEKSKASESITATVAADYHLAITVRFYYLISRVLQVQRDADLAGGRFMIPVRTHIENFVAELARIWGGLSREMQSDFKIQLTYSTAKIYIYELGLSANTTPFKSHSTPSRESDDGSAPLEGDIPIQCYLATKSFFDVYLTLPVSLYHQFPVTMITQLVHADLTLAKLTAYFRGNTRPPGVPEGVTLPAFADVIEAVASRFQRVRTVPHPLGYTVRNIIFDAFAVRLRSFKVLDLAGRKKQKKKEKEKAASQQQQHHGASQGHGQGHGQSRGQGPPAPSNISSSTRTPPTANAVLSISNLIGNVPEAMNTEPDSGSELAGPNPYPSIEMDLEVDNINIHGDLPDRSRPFTVDEEPIMNNDDMDMMELTGSDEEDQAEWWAWFGDFQSSLMGPPKVPSTTAGSVSGASAAGASAAGGAMSAGASVAGSTTGMSVSASAAGTEDSYSHARPIPGQFQRRKGPSSVGSIDSLLNNNDQEPDLNTYIQARKR